MRARRTERGRERMMMILLHFAYSSYGALDGGRFGISSLRPRRRSRPDLVPALRQSLQQRPSLHDALSPSPRRGGRHRHQPEARTQEERLTINPDDARFVHHLDGRDHTDRVPRILDNDAIWPKRLNRMRKRYKEPDSKRLRQTAFTRPEDWPPNAIGTLTRLPSRNHREGEIVYAIVRAQHSRALFLVTLPVRLGCTKTPGSLWHSVTVGTRSYGREPLPWSTPTREPRVNT